MLPLIIFLLIPLLSVADKLYVVERERGALAVVENGRLLKEIEGLGNLNHATLKLWKDKAYLISRDGYLSQIDTQRDELIKKVKVGNSTIGVDFTDRHIVVANYDPKTVVLLDEELNILHTIETGSRNVGIKGFSGGFVFSLMDRDEIWLVKNGRVRVFEAGAMPFDALLKGDTYMVGFFKEAGIGMLSVEKELFKKVPFTSEGREVVFKIPHFGAWGVFGDKAYVPAVGERKLYLLNLKKFDLAGSIELPGLPVFVVMSPDGKHAAVNFSGDMEDYLALVDAGNMEVAKSIPAGKRVMHMRFSKDGLRLYVSSYFDSKLRVLEVPSLKVKEELNIPNPSGVFLVR